MKLNNRNMAGVVLLIALSASAAYAQQQFTHTVTRLNKSCNTTCTVLDVPELNNNPAAISLPNCQVDATGRWEGGYARRLPDGKLAPVSVDLNLRKEAGTLKGELTTSDGTFDIVQASESGSDIRLQAERTIAGTLGRITLHGKLAKGDITIDGFESSPGEKTHGLTGFLRRLHIADSAVPPAVANQPYSFKLTAISPDDQAITFRLASPAITQLEQINWSTQADSLRGRNGERFTYVCPANGSLNSRLYGTDAYTDDSSICTAAVHSGLITRQAGGVVTIQIKPDAGSYTASTRNGISSRSYGAWRGSFVFVRSEPLGDPATTRPPAENPNGSTPNPRPASAPAYKSEDPKQESERINRLSEIAWLLQDPKEDTGALLTEAARLCGFAIWREDHSLISPPTGAALHLAITDNEIESFSAMFRSHQSVALADLINSVDYSYKKINPSGSTRANILKWLSTGDSSDNASVRALTLFLKDLNFVRGRGKSLEFSDPKAQLDPIQALLILRVVTEEIATPVRKAIFKAHPTGRNLRPQSGSYAFLPASYRTMPTLFDCAPEGKDWAEDAFVGGIAGLYEKAAEWVIAHAEAGRVGKEGAKELGEGYAKTLSWLNSTSSLVKFIATYAWLKGDIKVEAPGAPLIRTKDHDSGYKRTLVATFSIDRGKLDYWKEHRCWALFAGLDLDAPKNRLLSGIETSWRAGQSDDPKKQIIWIVPGQGSPDRILTNEDGEAKLEWEGAPQQVDLDPNKVTPWDRIVDITVTPQVKRPEIKQDMVDALMGALGIKGGGLGLLTPIYEQLYRLKWNGTAYYPLRVRDWEQAETIGGMTMFLTASAHNYRQNYAYQRNVERTIEFKDVAMQIVGGDMPEIDEEALAKMPPLKREQTEAGIKAAQEAAKKRSFIGLGPGKLNMTYSDVSYKRQNADECGDISQSEETQTASVPPPGPRDLDFGPQNFLPGLTNFSVDVDLDKMTATVKGDYALPLKAVIVKTEDKKTTTVNKNEARTFFHGLKPEAPFTDKGIVVPLTKEDLDSDLAALGWTGYSYSGKVTIPFTFGSYKGNAYLTFYIKRVMKKKTQ